MNDSVIVRRKVRRDFTTLDNGLIRDPRLSWKALGLLVYLLSLPGNFRLHLSFLAKQRKSGRDATRSGLKELEDAGYLSIERSHDSGGRFAATIWHVTDDPKSSAQPNSAPYSDNPYTVIPNAEFPLSENTTLINTNTKQELKEKRTTTTKSPNVEQQPGHIEELTYPGGLKPADTAQLRKALSTTPRQDAQSLLNELASAMAQGNVIRTTPMRWFFGVLKRYDSGQFVPTQALLTEKPTIHPPQEPKTTKAVGRAYLNDLRSGRRQHQVN